MRRARYYDFFLVNSPKLTLIAPLDPHIHSACLLLQGGASSWEKNLLRTRRDKKDQMWREICEEIARQKTTGRDDNRSPLWLLGGARSEILRLLKCTGLFWEADSA